jgi:hypothetical protein
LKFFCLKINFSYIKKGKNMDNYDFSKDLPKKPKIKFMDRILRGISRLFFLGTLCSLSFFAYTYLYPRNQFNPFPPQFISLTASPTPIWLSDDDVATSEPTLLPTYTPLADLPTATESVVSPTDTPILLPTQTSVNTDFATATPSIEAPPLFILQSGNPVYLPHPDGCEHMYVAGSVTDGEGNPLIFVSVELNGTIANQALFSEFAHSGTSKQYSESGYQLQIGDGPPANSAGTAYLQVYDQDGNIASDLFLLTTTSDCSKNLILMNFVLAP